MLGGRWLTLMAAVKRSAVEVNVSNLPNNNDSRRASRVASTEAAGT